MKVLFGVASLNYQQNKRIKLSIKAAGHSVYFENDHETAIESADKPSFLMPEDWLVLCRRELAAANDCDAAIFDVTNKATFGVGFLASIRLSRAVPTLFLLSEGSRNGSIITGLEQPQLMRRIYNSKNVGTIVSNFIEGVRW